MAEPWTIERLSAKWWRVHRNSPHNDSIDFFVEEHARRYAALPVLIETIRKGCDAERCIFCGWDWRDYVQHRTSDCPGIAALKAAGEET